MNNLIILLGGHFHYLKLEMHVGHHHFGISIKKFMLLLPLEEAQYFLSTDSAALYGTTGCIGEKRTI
jgi:hypothetical protein